MSRDRVPRHSDRGAGTVLMLAVLLTAATVLTLGAAAGRLVIVQHQVRSAADLAALAGGAATATGGDGCQVAQHWAEVNGVRVVRCVSEPGGMLTVRVRGGSGVAGWRPWSEARAGPAGAAGG